MFYANVDSFFVTDFCLYPSTLQARIEKLKAAQLARKASAGASSLHGSIGDTVGASIGECVGAVEATGASEVVAAGHTPSSPGATLPASIAHPDVAEIYGHEGAQVHDEISAFPGSATPMTN